MARVLAKSIFTLLVLNVYIMAHTSVTELKYEGGISLYGRVGTADVKLEEDFTNNRYKMKVTTQSVGLVKRLSSNRKDIYLSEGYCLFIIYFFKCFKINNFYVYKFLSGSGTTPSFPK